MKRPMLSKVSIREGIWVLTLTNRVSTKLTYCKTIVEYNQKTSLQLMKITKIRSTRALPQTIWNNKGVEAAKCRANYHQVRTWKRPSRDNVWGLRQRYQILKIKSQVGELVVHTAKTIWTRVKSPSRITLMFQAPHFGIKALLKDL